jgi:hypothetical protein
LREKCFGLPSIAVVKGPEGYEVGDIIKSSRTMELSRVRNVLERWTRAMSIDDFVVINMSHVRCQCMVVIRASEFVVDT